MNTSSPAEHTVPFRVAFLTGQSDPARCRLSPVQEAFLDRLDLAEAEKYRFNFPYDTGSAAFAATGLLRASLNNARQYGQSRGPAFRARYTPGVAALLAGAGHTVFLAGSCGVELLNNLQLPPDALDRISVFAYGPVARALPRCRTVIVQGRSDWISRCFVPVPDIIVPGGHLGYLERPEVQAACAAFLRQVRGEQVNG